MISYVVIFACTSLDVNLWNFTATFLWCVFCCVFCNQHNFKNACWYSFDIRIKIINDKIIFFVSLRNRWFHFYFYPCQLNISPHFIKNLVLWLKMFSFKDSNLPVNDLSTETLINNASCIQTFHWFVPLDRFLRRYSTKPSSTFLAHNLLFA